MKGEMRKFKFYVGLGFVGCNKEGIVELEIPVGANDEETEEIVREYFNEWIWQTIDATWTEVKE